jgi:O-antigen/teichoic acid export membrane protein
MIKSYINKGYKIGFFHLLSANTFIQIAAFASQLFVAGILPPEDIGRIKILQTYLALFIILGGFGFNASMLKLCSENRSPDDKRKLFSSAFLLTIITSVSLYILVVVLNYFHIFSTDKLIIDIFPVSSTLIVTNSIFLLFTGYSQANKQIEFLSKQTSINKFISIVGIIILCYYIGIHGYYIASAISLFLMLLFCFWKFKSDFDFEPRNIIKSFKIHFPYASKSMFSYFLSELSAYVDILLIGFFVNDLKEIGYYGFALTMTVVFRLIPSTIQQITIPYFSSSSDDKNTHTSLFRKYNKISILLIFLTLIISLIFVPVFLHYVFASKYDNSLVYYPFLAVGWSLRVSSVFPNGVIFGIGKIKYNIYTSLIVLSSNIILMLFTLHFWGLLGAAIVSIPVGGISLFFSYFFYKKSFSQIFKIDTNAQ